MIGFIYKTTCLVNGKIYIGQHVLYNDERDDKYLGSGVIFLKVLRKYGKENFKREILRKCETQKELNIWEYVYIKKYHSQNREIGYNIADGDVNSSLGNCAKSDFVREKIRKALSGSGNPNFHKKWSEKKRKQMEEMFANNPPMKGKHHSEETKKKWSEKRRGKDPFFNLSHEKKEQIYDKLRGVNNPMYGSTFIWINNGKQNKRHNEKLPIPEGWVLGYIRKNDKNNSR